MHQFSSILVQKFRRENVTDTHTHTYRVTIAFIILNNKYIVWIILAWMEIWKFGFILFHACGQSHEENASE